MIVATYHRALLTYVHKHGPDVNRGILIPINQQTADELVANGYLSSRETGKTVYLNITDKGKTEISKS